MVRVQGSVWEIYLNVWPLAAAGESVGSEPRLWQDKEDRLHVSGDADLCPDLPGHERFYAAANARGIRPVPVLITRRWCLHHRKPEEEGRWFCLKIGNAVQLC